MTSGKSKKLHFGIKIEIVCIDNHHTAVNIYLKKVPISAYIEKNA